MMEATQRWVCGDARSLGMADGSVALVVTSPPYPMIAMWDDCFGVDPEEPDAFESMHAVLDQVWGECLRVLIPGGICAINIGDATRTIHKRFRRYPNAARITMAMQARGFDVLPDILWRKPTNAPNKFMGSGMLPPGAYVTYEHEYILLFRKGAKRTFSNDEKANRATSAYFWEERNLWFSDLWSGLTGTTQALTDPGLRKRSAAFPLELPLRLIWMFSLYGDVVLDPFVGTGTTLMAAAIAGRHGIGVDREAGFVDLWQATMARSLLASSAEIQQDRLRRHQDFVRERTAKKGSPPKHHNDPHDMPVMTSQETALELLVASGQTQKESTVTVEYERALRSLF